MSDLIWAAVMVVPSILALARLTGGRRPGQFGPA